MKIVPTIHPSYVMRGNWALLSLLGEDLKKAREECASGVVSRAEVEYVTSPTIDDAKRVLRPDDPRPLTVDIETTAAGDIWCCGATREPFKAACFPWIEPFIGMFREAFAGAREVVAQNAAFDMPRLARALGRGIVGRGAITQGKWFDTMVAHALVEPDHPHSLAHLGTIYSDLLPWKDDENDSKEIYNCKDVDVTARAHVALQGEMRREGVLSLFDKTISSISPVLCEMRRVGIRVDLDRMRVVRGEIDEEIRGEQAKVDGLVEVLPSRRAMIDEARREADELEEQAEPLDKPGTKREAGKLRTRARKLREAAEGWRHVNVNAPAALASLLYEELGLPVQRKDKKVTTEDGALAELIRRTNHPILQSLRDLRELVKLRGTYLDYHDERLHSELMAHGTGTGRLSSREPNLQNIPARNQIWAPKIKSIFVPTSDEWEFFELDYEQIERRIQAWASKEPRLIEAFEKGIDIHTQAASLIYRISMEKVTKQQRYFAKRAVYGKSYGMGPLKFSRELAKEGMYVSMGEARMLLEGLDVAYPVLRAHMEQVVRTAQQTHRLRNAFGRFRYFFADAYGDAMNFEPQSTAADVILEKMVRIQKELPEPARMLLQVHDSILGETPREIHDEVIECVREIMESPVEAMGGWRCPVDAKTRGRSWAFLRE